MKNADVSKKSADFTKNFIILEKAYKGLLPCPYPGL